MEILEEHSECQLDDLHTVRLVPLTKTLFLLLLSIQYNVSALFCYVFNPKLFMWAFVFYRGVTAAGCIHF